MQVENDLQGIDPSITIPYWDWTEDAAMEHPESSPIWKEDFMGGNGVEEEGWRVGTGQFPYEKGNWPIPIEHDGPALTRRFGSWPRIATLPTREDLGLAMSETFYDTPPYSVSPFTIGFRNRIEGWVTQRGDSRVKTSGSQLHNRVHLWVGGTWKEDGEDKVGSMVLMTSPNDPVFFLHHCFIDKVWADWQAGQQLTNPEAYPHYAPEEEGPPGHNLNDQLQPWERRILQVLDISKLGYEYERTPSLSRMLESAVAAAPTFPFDVGRTPFAAE